MTGMSGNVPFNASRIPIIDEAGKGEIGQILPISDSLSSDRKRRPKLLLFCYLL